MTSLALESVSVTLDGARIVDGVSTTLAQGEWVALIGPNGAGKSTLLRAVAGIAPHAGSIRIGGDDAALLGRRDVARRLALVPQSPVLPAEMTVSEYVLLGRTPYVGYFGNEGRSDFEAADRALTRLDLLGLARRRLGSLSGGERQRAVLARAFAQEAPLLLLDEPTSALDVGRQQQALELVDGLRREEGLTVLCAMHDLTLAGEYADRLLLMDGGCLVASGDARDVLTETLIAEHYGARVRIVAEESLGIAVIPARLAPRVPHEARRETEI
jgi:iron complex transport system ATP-binding protein